jgi:hypothetical protein
MSDDLLAEVKALRRDLQELPDAMTSAIVQAVKREAFFLGLCLVGYWLCIWIYRAFLS